MKRRLGSVAAASALALTIGAISAPAASAADGSLTFIQGIPGQAVELCVNGQELKKQFKYGGKFTDTFAPGNYTIKIKTKAQGNCNGQLIVKRTISAPEDSAQIVVSQKTGGGFAIRTFDANVLFKGSVPADPYAGVVVSHAAKLGGLDTYIAETITPANPVPSFHLKQGKQNGYFVDEGYFSTWLTKGGTTTPIFGPKNKLTAQDRVNHFVAIGVKSKNFRLVYLRLPFPPES